jgi:hypothetical protein
MGTFELKYPKLFPELADIHVTETLIGNMLPTMCLDRMYRKVVSVSKTPLSKLLTRHHPPYPDRR